MATRQHSTGELISPWTEGKGELRHIIPNHVTNMGEFPRVGTPKVVGDEPEETDAGR